MTLPNFPDSPTKPSPFRRTWPAWAALALFILVSCVLEGDRTAKRGSEVENEIYGVLVAVNGDPMAGAKVKAVPVSAQVAKRGAAADSDSTVTDKDGKYSLRGLGPGTYNLFGDYQSGNLVVLIPGVDHGDTSKPKDQGVDTLRAPGRIRGRLLAGKEGKEGVLAYVPGTSYLAVSDDSGMFMIGGVPQGRYAVRYSAPGFVIEPDTGVQVLAGRIVDLPAKQLAIDPSGLPPAPAGLRAEFDTLASRVILQWSPVKVADLAGYVVYREAPGDAEPVPVSGGVVADTTYRDDKLDGIPVGTRLIYRIKARDSGANLSATFSSAVEVIRGPLARTSEDYLLDPHRLHPELEKRVQTDPVVFRDRIFLVGGRANSGEVLGDVWSTGDGTNWDRILASAEFGNRHSHGMAEFKDKLYLIGGAEQAQDERGLNDVWVSEDGASWSRVTAAAGFPPRRWPRVFVHGSKLWVMGGVTDSVPGMPSDYKYFWDLWSSEDGRTWDKVVDILPSSWFACCPKTVFGDSMAYIANAYSNPGYSLMISDDGREETWRRVDIGAAAPLQEPVELFHDGHEFLVFGFQPGRSKMDMWRMTPWGIARLAPGPGFEVGGRIRAIRFRGYPWLWTESALFEEAWRPVLWRIY